MSDKLRALIPHWEAESKRVKALADKEKSERGRESLMAQSVRYSMCANELKEVFAGCPPPTKEKRNCYQRARKPLGNATASAPVEPWLFAIEDKQGKWKDGEQCVFDDRVSAQDEVNMLNDDFEEGDEEYKVVPLYRA